MNWNNIFDLHSPYVHRRKEIIPALIGAAAGIGTTLMNQFQTDKVNQQSYRMFSQQMRENSLEATRQRDWEEKMWSMNNAYNTPAAQMQRYKDANLNPFLVGQDSLSPGQSSLPSSGAHASNGVIPAMHVADNSPMLSVGQHLQDIVRLSLQKRQIDASSADNTAKAESEIIDNALKIRKQFGEQPARQYYESRMQELRGASIDSSEEWNNYLRQNEEQRYRTEVARVESNIMQKYGEQKAKQTLDNMQAEYDKLQSEYHVNEELQKLYQLEQDYTRAKTDSERKEIEVKQAKIKDLVASAADHYASAVAHTASARLSVSEAVIKEDAKDYLVGKLKSDFVVSAFSAGEAAADYESNAYVRSWKKSKTSKEWHEFRWMMDNNPASGATQSVLGTIGNIFKVNVIAK